MTRTKELIHLQSEYTWLHARVEWSNSGHIIQYTIYILIFLQTWYLDFRVFLYKNFITQAYKNHEF